MPVPDTFTERSKQRETAKLSSLEKTFREIVTGKQSDIFSTRTRKW